MHSYHTLVAQGAGGSVTWPSLVIDPETWWQKLLDISGLSGDLKEFIRVFNSGAPGSRTRREPVKSTFLNNANMRLNWPCRFVVALKFPQDTSPLEYTEEVLKKRGYQTPDDAVKAHENLPNRLFYCHKLNMSRYEILNVSPHSDAEFLRFALILGLCGPNYYDPQRPVIWTEGRLTRAVGLYLPRGFYED
jgi:hypothetical protein